MKNWEEEEETGNQLKKNGINKPKEGTEIKWRYFVSGLPRVSLTTKQKTTTATASLISKRKMILSEILHYWARLCNAGHVMVIVYGLVDYHEDMPILISHKVFKLLNISSEIIKRPRNSFFIFPLSHLQSASLLNFPQKTGFINHRYRQALW
jgi:hypothetical protein